MNQVASLPVSRRCNFILLATGEYDRQSVERFIAQLKLQLELGAFDPEPKQDSATGDA